MGHPTETAGESPRPTGRSGPAATPVDPSWAPLCLTSLVASYDQGRRLFSHQLFDGTWCEVDAVYPHETLTSSCIALLGLARAGIDPADHGIDTAACLEAIVGEVGRTNYPGGLGLAVWANALAGDAPLSDHLRPTGLRVDRLAADLVPSLTTMETAWLASGLLHELARRDDPSVRAAATAVVAELRTARYASATRLMRHAGSGASPLHRSRGHIANFADQIYSVQAFAFAGLVLDDTAALAVGTALADRHCELQGEQGQWWWHYDARAGHVALKYAVYSVHQHGMAPMALAAIGAATGRSYDRAIDASRRWIDDNELGTSMVDVERATIWRSLERVEPAVAGRVRGALETLGVEDRRTAQVELNRETRPYEWAWCLYASAIATGAPKGHSLV